MKLISKRPKDYDPLSSAYARYMDVNPKYRCISEPIEKDLDPISSAYARYIRATPVSSSELNVLCVDDDPTLLRVTSKVVGQNLTSLSNLTDSANKQKPFLSFNQYDPSKRSDVLDVYYRPSKDPDVGLLGKIVYIFNSAMSDDRKKITLDILLTSLGNLRSSDSTFGVSDGLECLLVCCATPIDIVVTDLDMPRANAYSTLRALNRLGEILGSSTLKSLVQGTILEKFSLPRTIVVSGGYLSASQQAIFEAGAVVAGTKPFSPKHLFAAINYVLFGVLDSDPKNCFEIQE